MAKRSEVIIQAPRGVEVIHGLPPSKSNSYRVIAIRGRGSLTKTKKAKDYESAFDAQLTKYRDAGLDGELGIKIVCYYDSRRPDLDGSSKIILDCLQKGGAFKNDNKVIYLEMHKKLDKDRPRIEFEIWQIL